MSSAPYSSTPPGSHVCGRLNPELRSGLTILEALRALTREVMDARGRMRSMITTYVDSEWLGEK